MVGARLTYVDASMPLRGLTYDSVATSSACAVVVMEIERVVRIPPCRRPD